MKDIKNTLSEKAEEIAKEMNLEIFEINIKGSKRRKTIEIIIDDLKDFVSIETCANFSRKIEPWCEEQDFPFGSYDLIISSPGLDRPLRSKEDFIRFKGKLAKIITKNKVENRNSFTGYIKNIENDEIIIEEKSSKKSLFKIEMDNISRANLEIDF
ncbi:hypothetical protein OF820_11530 [Oceanotoga sp. DSM 15011]|uniref:ribosome maturation factor RimP n=1 Tax=unclassified Oceanotoga TaxID=2618448 RepID=UPI0021F487EB|nr:MULTISPECIES: hypothetical protein [unclassified Oceanotoga]MDN5343842.1 ribosome maturation factor RimP [Oceanotoga sp.]UYO99676.1 hypothetical protein OF820_11530 [Oceanotoga sp. DSM 15011]